ncbi:hypothetical protein JOH51_004368 [Rhizobium leguminosarum]|nr:hypothetical protein [Rhizobium leguminosarum]
MLEKEFNGGATQWIWRSKISAIGCRALPGAPCVVGTFHGYHRAMPIPAAEFGENAPTFVSKALM